MIKIKKPFNLKQYLTFLTAVILVGFVALVGFEKIYFEFKLVNQNKQITQLEQVNATLVEQSNGLTNLIATQQRLISNLNIKKTELEQEFNKANEDSALVEASIADLLELNDLLQKQIADLNRQLLSNLVVDNEGQDIKLLNELNLDYDALISQTRTQIDYYNEEINSYINLNLQLANSNFELFNLIDDLKTEIVSKQVDRKILVDDFDNINSIKEELTVEITAIKDDILEIDLEEIDNEQLKEKLENFFNQYQTLLDSEQDFLLKIFEIDQEISSLQEISASLEDDYQTLLKSNADLLEAITIFTVQRDSQLARLIELDDEINKINDDILNLELFVANNTFNVSLNDINYVSQVSIKANAMIRLASGNIDLSDNKYGSGIVIDAKPGSSSLDSEFYILTNYETIASHISNSDTIYVFNYFFNIYTGAVLLHYDSKFALLSIEAPINTFIAVSLFDASDEEADYQISASELVFSISSQARHINALRVGRVAEVIYDEEIAIEIESFTHNAFLIGQALKGGAILNKNYKLIGFNYFGIDNKAYSIEQISKFLLTFEEGE